MKTYEQALAFWISEIGDKEYAYDFSGRKIRREDYMVDNQVGWVISHLKPIELNGPDNIGNTIIMNHRTLEEKGSDYPKFTAFHSEFMVYYESKEDFYYVEKVLDEDEDEEGIFI